MKKFVALFALSCVFALSANASDGEKPKAKEEKTVRVEKKTETVREEKKGFGSRFKGFWIHSVGGTINNGLRRGADKIANTFD